MSDDFSLAMARGTSHLLLYGAEDAASVAHHIARSVTGGAGFCGMSRFAATAVARIAGHLLLNFEFLSHTRGDFLECEAGFKPQVAAAILLRSRLFGTKATKTAKATAHSTENVAEVREDVVDICETLAAAETALSVYALFSELIVALALLGVAQYFIGFCGLFEFLLGFFVAGVLIGVIFHGHLAVSLFDFGIACPFVDA